jgi:hypothetical protein
VELIGGTADLRTPVGLLDLDLEVIPTPPPASFTHVDAPPSESGPALAKSTRSLPVYIPQAVIVKQVR